MADPLKNFAYSTVVTAPSPATSGTSLVVASGEGARFPDPATDGAFNVTIWPLGVIATPANAEIARCTARSTDTLTITRAQEGSTARSVVVGDQIAATITKKVLDDKLQLKSFTYIAQGTTLYTKPAGITSIYVECIGPGGGGGGAAATTAGNLSLGGGGGGGGYAAVFIVSAASSYDVVVGAGGAGVSGAAGSAGSAATTFGATSVCTAGAATGGDVLSSGSSVGIANGGNRALGTVGDLLLSGSAGCVGLRLSGSVGIGGQSGAAARGGQWRTGATSQSNGGAGGIYGGGGAGACSVNGGGAQTGGAGADGRIIVWEYGP